MSETVSNDQGDILTVAVASASDALDTQRRPWLLGVAHLVDHPLSGEFSEESVQSVIDIAMATVQSPSGPVDFIPSVFAQTLNTDYRMITLAGDAAPHLELKIGFGIAGVVAVGLTRSDVLDDGSTRPGAVVLTDLESVLADTVTLAIGSAIELGYTRATPAPSTSGSRSRTTATTSSSRASASRRTAARCSRADGSAFEPVGGRLRFTMQTTPRQVHEFLYDLAVDASGQLGTRTQLVGLLPEDDESYQGEPLKSDEHLQSGLGGA